MSARSTTRKRLTAEERRGEILGAALAVFGEHGYHSSSIDDIARAAGISKALIYEHFESKEALHLSLLESHARELFERLAASAGGDGSAATGPVQRVARGSATFQLRPIQNDSGLPQGHRRT